MCTMMAGVLLVVLGATGMGSAVKFIPRPVVIGFTNGIAVLIASTQIKDFFGLSVAKVPGEFWLRIKVLAAAFPSWSWRATLLAMVHNCRDGSMPCDFESHSGTNRGHVGRDPGGLSFEVSR
jgi:SulP family sulfate permease